MTEERYCSGLSISNCSVDVTFSSLTIRLSAKHLILRVSSTGYNDTCLFGLAHKRHSDGQVVLGYMSLAATYAVFHLGRDEVYLAQSNFSRNSYEFTLDRLTITDDVILGSIRAIAEQDSPSPSPTTATNTGTASEMSSAVTGSSTSGEESSPVTSAQATDYSTVEEGASSSTAGAAKFDSKWSAFLLSGLCAALLPQK